MTMETGRERQRCRLPGLLPAVTGLVQFMVIEAVGDGAELQEPHLQATVASMIKRLYIMPRYFGIPFTLLSVLFDWLGIVFAGRRFHRQNRKQQQRQLRIWRGLPLGVLDSFVDFYQKMSTFTYFHLAEQRAGIGGPDRQE